jgi:hypothetical protein
MSPQSHSSGQRPTAPSVCDHCGGPMKLVRVVSHPEKDGDLHVYECSTCKLPVVQFVPR